MAHDVQASFDATTDAHPELRVIPRDQHDISRKDLSPNAVKVLYRLIQAGYEAYVVGGCVRDILLGYEPKDFDVATSARPDEIKALFRNARLIGRRFRLAHVRVGGEIIEVSTFRSQNAGEPSIDGHEGSALVMSSSGMIVEDNVYGTKDQDALRRDFTINALYYTPKDFTLHEYVGAMDDLDDRILRTIGDPAVRFREDPVRMLRAVRLAAKLDLDIAPETLEPIPRLARLLREVPPARLFDELQKMLLGGASRPTWALLKETGLLAHLLPELHDALDARAERLLDLAMRNTDERIHADKAVTPGFLFAVLLWPPLRKLLASTRMDHDDAVAAALGVISRQNAITSVPARFAGFARDVWDLQPRLERAVPKRVRALLDHPRFRAAYDFLVLRTEAGELPPDRAAFWTEVQEEGVDPEEAFAAVVAAREQVGGTPIGDDVPGDGEMPLPDRKPRKRRRRGGRRRSGGGDAAAKVDA